MTSHKIDRIDVKILDLLQKNAAKSAAEIGEQVNLSQNACWRRISQLEKEGYISWITKKGKKVHKSIEVGLVYDEYGPRVKGVERVSKLSKRIYAGSSDLKRVKQGHGVLVLTTPQGIMTDADARKQKVGGELLFKIW